MTTTSFDLVHEIDEMMALQDADDEVWDRADDVWEAFYVDEEEDAELDDEGF